MHWLDITIIGLFVLYSIRSGLRSRSKASENLEEYLLAGRSLPGWKAGISMAATQFAADTPLLVMGLIATAGIFSLWQLWIYALAFLLMGFLLAPQWRRANVLTDAEFTELRYSSSPAAFLRVVKAVYFGTIFNCIVLAWVLFAAAKISEPFLLWNEWLPTALFQPVAHLAEWIGVPVTSLAEGHPDTWIKTASNMISLAAIVFVTTAYSTTGGLRSVVDTDVAQFFIMILGTLLFALVVVVKAGGLDAIHAAVTNAFGVGENGMMTARQALAFTPLEARNAGFSILALFALQWLIQLNADGTGYLAQRSMACRSDHDSKVAAVVFAFSQVLLRSLLWIPLGLGLLALYPLDPALTEAQQIAAREGTYVRGIAELLPIGVRGIMLTAMLAALASTLDTHLNWGAGYWTNDIYKRVICEAWLKKEPSRRSLVVVARVSNLCILFVAFFVMTRLRSIQETWQISLLLGAGMGPVLLLRWLWWRINAWSEIAAIVVSAGAAPILLYAVDDQAVRLLVLALLSVTASVLAAFLVGPEPTPLLQKFYDQIGPLGFWGPFTSRQEGDRRIAFYRAIFAAATTALSIFCLLIGIGSWLARTPAPFWMPWPALWIPLLLLLGVALVPVWLRLGFRREERG